MTKEFTYQFHELEIKPNDIAELMGFENSAIPDPFADLINETILSAPELFNIKAGFSYFDSVIVDIKYNTLKIKDQLFSPGKTITNQLKNATSCALFVCTAGNLIDHQSIKTGDANDQIRNYIYDVLGSIVAEKTRIKTEVELKNAVSQYNLKISDSFSPGYCNWNIAEQAKLFSLLPHKFCGVTLSESNLMIPIKSVSGIIGIGKTLKQNGYQCKWCLDTDCLYGKINRQKKN